MPEGYLHLTCEQRCQIYALLQSGHSQAHIARQIGVDPSTMAGGINNPLGARALYLGSSLYRIHGSNERYTIGQAVSSGCFRMTNEDVVDLYNRVASAPRWWFSKRSALWLD